MFDVALYGHLTIDRIFDGNREQKTLGAIANVWDTLLQLDSSLKVSMNPTQLGEAYIYCDLERAQRYSRGVLNLKTIPFSVSEARVSHVIYINELPEPEILKEINGVVTADVCVGKELNQDLLRYVDLLFISDEDVSDAAKLVEKIRGWVLVHSSSGSHYMSRERSGRYSLPSDKILKNVNVLGAGDMFAAAFLQKLIPNPERLAKEIDAWVEYAHLTTTAMIGRKQ